MGGVGGVGGREVGFHGLGKLWFGVLVLGFLR